VTARFIDQTPFVPVLAWPGSPLVEVAHPSRQPGDVLVAMYVLHDATAVVTSRPSPPPGWSNGPGETGGVPTSTVPFSDGQGRVGLFFQVVTEANIDISTTTFINPQGTFSYPTQSIFAVSIACLRGVLLVAGVVAFDEFTASGTKINPPGSIQAVTVSGPDRLVVAVALANHSTLGQTGPPGGYRSERETHSSYTRGASSILYSRVSDVSVNAVLPATFTVPGVPVPGYATFGFSLPPAPVAVSARPAIPGPENLQLDCAETYEVFITGRDYTTVIDAVPYSSINWQRILDDASEAKVVVPDRLGGLRCVAAYGGLVPWRYGIRIERNSQEVWSGPVVGVDRGDGAPGDVDAVTVSASDVLARYKKRLITDTVSYIYTNEDAGRILAGVLTSSTHAFDRWRMPAPTVLTGTAMSREIKARDFELAWDVLKDLFDAAIDAWVYNGRLVVYEPSTGWVYVAPNGEIALLEGPYNDVGELVYGLFTDEAFERRPGWSISGMAQSNRAWVPGGDSGEAGFRLYWTASASPTIWELDGVLDVVDVDSLHRASDDDTPVSDTVFQRHADSLVAARAIAPAVITGGTLAQGAPVDVVNLRPGSLWTLDIHDAGRPQLLQISRLKSVDVEVSVDRDAGVVEAVTPTLVPVGFTEAS
jgi:hypothetical protein